MEMSIEGIKSPLSIARIVYNFLIVKTLHVELVCFRYLCRQDKTMCTKTSLRFARKIRVAILDGGNFIRQERSQGVKKSKPDQFWEVAGFQSFMLSISTIFNPWDKEMENLRRRTPIRRELMCNNSQSGLINWLIVECIMGVHCISRKRVWDFKK